MGHLSSQSVCRVNIKISPVTRGGSESRIYETKRLRRGMESTARGYYREVVRRSSGEVLNACPP